MLCYWKPVSAGTKSPCVPEADLHTKVSKQSDKSTRLPCATARAQKPLCICSSPRSPPEGSMLPQVEQQSPLRTKNKLGAFRAEKVTSENASLQRVSP